VITGHRTGVYDCCKYPYGNRHINLQICRVYMLWCNPLTGITSRHDLVANKSNQWSIEIFTDWTLLSWRRLGWVAWLNCSLNEHCQQMFVYEWVRCQIQYRKLTHIRKVSKNAALLLYTNKCLKDMKRIYLINVEALIFQKVLTKPSFKY